ncbi:MAG: glycosyltransferase family 4 protein [Anaerocolumna sp.]
MKKIAIVNQRYGLEVNGGSEYYTRRIAEKLAVKYDVEIITTRALNYDTWENYYPEGIQYVEGIKVRRFSVVHKREKFRFRVINKLIRLTEHPPKLLQLKWIDEQGPLSKALIKFISANQNNYDIFIFVTYLYYHTFKGLPKVANKAVLIPTAHDEPYINFNIFKPIFNMPKAIVYLTEEEKELVINKFNNIHIPHYVIGMGIDVPSKIDVQLFREKHNIINQYIIYVGRVDVGKNCDVMFEYFLKYKQEAGNNLKLLIMGSAFMNIPSHPDIIYLGFVDEEDKFNGIAGANTLLLPSEYESLSISVLEAMALSVPVLVNGKCTVLRGHCEKSKGGLYYNNYDEFEKHLNKLLKEDEAYQRLCRNAKRYIEENYRWDLIIDKMIVLLEKI